MLFKVFRSDQGCNDPNCPIARCRKHPPVMEAVWNIKKEYWQIEVDSIETLLTIDLIAAYDGIVLRDGDEKDPDIPSIEIRVF